MVLTLTLCSWCGLVLFLIHLKWRIPAFCTSLTTAILQPVSLVSQDDLNPREPSDCGGYVEQGVGGWVIIYLFIETKSHVAQPIPQLYRAEDDLGIHGSYKIEIFFFISFILYILGGFPLSVRCSPPPPPSLLIFVRSGLAHGFLTWCVILHSGHT